MANPFAGDVARRYHFGRPRHHERTLRRVGLAGPGLALDVAGGTGLSTGALQTLGFDAVCVDLALPMLAFAPPPAVAGAAELLPFRDGCACVVTVSSGVHWFDQHAFYAEARRVLAPGGLLVLYEHGMQGMPGDDRFESWVRDVYRARYPTPPRSGYAGTIAPDGFERVAGGPFVEDIPFTHRALVDYLLTQSNTVVAVEQGEQTEEEVRAWLARETSVFFAGRDVRDVSFWGAIDAWR